MSCEVVLWIGCVDDSATSRESPGVHGACFRNGKLEATPKAIADGGSVGVSPPIFDSEKRTNRLVMIFVVQECLLHGVRAVAACDVGVRVLYLLPVRHHPPIREPDD